MKSPFFPHRLSVLISALSLCLFAFAARSAFAEPEVSYEPETPTLTRRLVGLRITPFELIMLTDPSHTTATHATVDLGVGRYMTLGPRFTYYRSKNGFHDDRGYGLGLEGSFYLNGSRFENSWLFIPYLGMHSQIYRARDAFQVSSPMLSTSAMAPHGGTWFGYQWHWTSGFNIRLAAGLDYFAIPKELPLSGGPAGETGTAFTDGGLQGASEFTIGMIF